MIKKTLLSFLIIIGLFGPLEILAVNWLPLVPCGREGAPPVCNLCHFWQLGSNIINFLIFGLAVPLTIILFIWAGVLLLTSGGSEERIKTGKKVFTNTVIGIVIVFTSWLIIDTAIKRLVFRREGGQWIPPETEAGIALWAWNNFPACQ